jgi:hypothetical protein
MIHTWQLEVSHHGRVVKVAQKRGVVTKALPRDGLRIAAEFARTKAEIVLAQVEGACAITKAWRVGKRKKIIASIQSHC